MKAITAILAQHVAVLGKTGSGKTSTAKLAIEQVVAAGARVCVLDPIKSDWWGLTSSANGKHAGLPFHILGGPHGHVPLHSGAGKAIAEVVAAGTLPLSIIDMADFEPGGQARFFVDFAPALLRKMRGVVYLVIEEAHLFAPKERSGIGAENLSIHWAKTMATAGRSKGVRLVLVTQRTQALHNALLGSCDTLIAHRLTAPADQEPVVKWLKANTSKEVLEQVSASLASLKTGEGWICSGEARIFERVVFPRMTTYDNTATPTGDGDLREIKTAPVDPERLRAIIGDAVEKAKADDPRELRKQIAELKSQLSKAAHNMQPKLQPGKTVEKFVLKDGQLVRAENLLGRMAQTFDKHDESLHALKTDCLRAMNEIAAAIAQTRAPQPNTPTTRTPVHSPQGRRVAPAAATSRPASLVSPSSNGHLQPAKQKILNALAWLGTIGQDVVERQVAAFIAGTSSKSSAYENNISALRTLGLIDYPGPNRLRLTADGAALAVTPDAPLTPTELHERLQALLQPAQWRIVEAAISVYPKAVTREELAEIAGVSAASSAYENNVSRMRSLGLLDYPQQGMVAAQPVLFLEEQ